WLQMDEQECIDLVMMHHESEGDYSEDKFLHAAIHTAVENQLAMPDEQVQRAFKRLMEEGLDRHDALHAVGSVLAEHMWRLMKEETEEPASVEDYYRGLRELTAEKWRTGR
ncbi:MAG: DUF1841 family protein, partial [Pseudomonadota bacterium]